MLADTRIIARQSTAAGAMVVLAQRHEVLLMDCKSLQMHPIWQHGAPVARHRALEREGGRLQLVDLDALAPGLDAEVRRSPARDVPGVVLYTLRQRYARAEDLLAQADRTSLGDWMPLEGGGHEWQPRATAPTLRRAA